MRNTLNSALAIVAILWAAPALAANNIMVENDCKHDIRFFIHYNPRGDVWLNRGWWIAQSGTTIFLSDTTNVRLTHLKESQLYVYGYAMDALGTWSQDSARRNKTTYEGDDFYLLPMSDVSPAASTDTLVKFTCD